MQLSFAGITLFGFGLGLSFLTDSTLPLIFFKGFLFLVAILTVPVTFWGFAQSNTFEMETVHTAIAADDIPVIIAHVAAFFVVRAPCAIVGIFFVVLFHFIFAVRFLPFRNRRI
jgi:hypothetical protein